METNRNIEILRRKLSVVCIFLLKDIYSSPSCRRRVAVYNFERCGANQARITHSTLTVLIVVQVVPRQTASVSFLSSSTNIRTMQQASISFSILAPQLYFSCHRHHGDPWSPRFHGPSLYFYLHPSFEAINTQYACHNAPQVAIPQLKFRFCVRSFTLVLLSQRALMPVKACTTISRFNYCRIIQVGLHFGVQAEVYY
jgi:hypothetical protein